MTNFQSQINRPAAAWLTPERAVVVVPILAGLALAATLATAVITPQMVQHEVKDAIRRAGLQEKRIADLEAQLREMS